MDIATAILLALVLVVVLVIALVALAGWRTHVERQVELARAKLEWDMEKGRRLDGYNPKKGGKKRKKQEEDEDEDVDDLDVLIEAARPFKSFLGGYLQSQRVPVDVDALFEHDAGEKSKVTAFLVQQSRGAKGGGGAEPEWVKLAGGEGSFMGVGR